MTAGSKQPLQSVALALATLGALGTLVLCASDLRRGLAVYLAAFGFLASTALGGLILLMIMYACSARWFVVLRRLAEGIAGSAPALPLLFLPVALGLHQLYPWARPHDELPVLARESLEHARAWLAPRAFVLHALGYFAIWLATEELLRRASLAED